MNAYVILITVCAYLLFMFAIAWVAGSKSDNSAFFNGSRKSKWYIAALAMIGAPMSGVTETLRRIRACGRYRMVLLTKGDLLDQEHKVLRSGLEPFFDRVVVVSNKSKREYSRLMKELDVSAEQFLAVGNSFKSDIQPVLELGGWGIHIPFHVLWELEKTEEFDHERLLRVTCFEEIAPILCQSYRE